MADDAKALKVRRQFGLILTLISHRYGLLKDEIFVAVPEYASRYKRHSDDPQDDLTQLFERDKREIRELGIVIETFTVEQINEGGHDTRYRIVEEDYEFPEDVVFSSAEMALMRLAGEAWRGGSLSMDSRHALTKLRSLGIPASEPLIGIAPRISTHGPVFEPLSDLLDKNAVATFLYLKPGEVAPRLRTAAPLALVQRRGLWHVLAFDYDAQAERTFLLSRIVSTPARRGTGVHEREQRDYAALLEAELDSLDAHNVAEVWVEPGSDAAVRLSATHGEPNAEGTIRINFSDINVLADDLTEFGRTLKVLSPDALSAAMRTRFADLVRAHGESQS